MARADQCPECGGRTLQHGYGLMGGGMGAYVFCTRKGCRFLHVDKECPVCEAVMVGDVCRDCGDAEARKVLLAKRYPPTCGGCRTSGNFVNGACVHVCRDGLPCGYTHAPT